MRKIAILALLLLTAAATFAAPVLPEKAQQSASKFLRQHRPGVTLKSSPPSTPKMRGSGQQTPSYFIFNTEGNKGYVIVSGDDRTIPILGYIDKGSFDANHVPSNMQAWLDSYCDQIASLDALGITEAYESNFTMKPTRPHQHLTADYQPLGPRRSLLGKVPRVHGRYRGWRHRR